MTTTFLPHGNFGDGFAVAEATERDAKLQLAGVLIRNPTATWGPVHLAANQQWVAFGFIPNSAKDTTP